MYKYEIENIRVVDGDTIDCDIDLGFGVWLSRQRVRLARIDAPETRTKDLEEKERGLETKARVDEWLKFASHLYLQSYSHRERGKFGRILGDVFRDQEDESLSDYLLRHGLVKRYGE